MRECESASCIPAIVLLYISLPLSHGQTCTHTHTHTCAHMRICTDACTALSLSLSHFLSFNACMCVSIRVSVVIMNRYACNCTVQVSVSVWRVCQSFSMSSKVLLNVITMNTHLCFSHALEIRWITIRNTSLF